jgi:hypothetical protein
MWVVRSEAISRVQNLELVLYHNERVVWELRVNFAEIFRKNYEVLQVVRWFYCFVGVCFMKLARYLLYILIK